MGLFKINPSQILNKAKLQGSPEENDAVSAVIGNYGRWQLMMNLILPFFAFPSTFHLYLPTFTTKLTDFWCKRPANLSTLPVEYWINYSQPIDACSVRMLPAGITAESIMNNTAPILDSFLKCTEWDYDRSEVGNTIISEWDLICDKAGLTTLSEVAFLISVGVGGVLGGWFSDKFIVPESPRWLLSVGKIQEAKIVLQKAAKFNNRTNTEDLDKILTSHTADNKRENPSVLMLFKGYLLKRTFCLFVAWFSMSIAYYGLVLNIGKFNLGNLHVTSIILAAVEIPAIALSIPILFKTGRRTPVFASMIICGLACIASELFSVSLGNAWVIISCLMVGKFTISGTNVMLPIYTAELYPTVIRNLGVGATQVAAGLALICIPYLWDLTALNAHLPMSTLALLSIAGGGVILLLPDTKSAKNEMGESANAASDGTCQSTENTI
nr:solute carrier family 22 member 21-like isoform X2 [Maniola hyperantus]